MIFSRDGDMLALVMKHDGTDKTSKGLVCLWRGLQKASDPKAPALTLGKEWKFHHAVEDVAFAPDGSRLAVSYGTGPINLYNLKDLDATPRTLNPENKGNFEHSMDHLAWSPEGSRLVAEVHFRKQTKTFPPKVMIWTPEGTLLRSMETTLSAHPVFRNENELLTLTVTHAGNARGQWKDVAVSRFDLQKNSHDTVQRYTFSDDQADVTRFKISSDYQRLALSNKGHELAILELAPDGPIQSLNAIQAKPQFAVCKKADHKIAWTGNNGRNLIAGIDLWTAEPLPADELKTENFGPLGKPKVNHRGMVEVKVKGVDFTVSHRAGTGFS